MAEPGDRGSGSMRVSREFSVSRLEKQLLVKVYDLLIPVVQKVCSRSQQRAKRVRGFHRIDSTSRTKGT
jgi:hypothetical protein